MRSVIVIIRLLLPNLLQTNVITLSGGYCIFILLHFFFCIYGVFYFLVSVSTTVEHVIMHVICELESDQTIASSTNNTNINRSSCSSNNDNMNDTCSDVDYVLKVAGLAEYLTSHTTLADYEYIRQCIKLEQDVLLVLIHVDQLQRPLARTVSIC